MYWRHKPYLHLVSHFSVVYGFFVKIYFVQLGPSSWPRELDKPPWLWRHTVAAFPFIRNFTRGKSWNITTLFPKLVGRIAKTSSFDHVFMQSFCSPIWENLLVCWLSQIWTPCATCWKVSDHRYSAFLICVSNTQVLTKSVKIDQSKGIPDPCYTWNNLLWSQYPQTFFCFLSLCFVLFFSCAVFRAVPWEWLIDFTLSNTRRFYSV